MKILILVIGQHKMVPTIRNSLQLFKITFKNNDEDNILNFPQKRYYIRENRDMVCNCALR